MKRESAMKNLELDTGITKQHKDYLSCDQNIGEK